MKKSCSAILATLLFFLTTLVAYGADCERTSVSIREEKHSNPLSMVGAGVPPAEFKKVLEETGCFSVLPDQPLVITYSLSDGEGGVDGQKMRGATYVGIGVATVIDSIIPFAGTMIGSEVVVSETNYKSVIVTTINLATRQGDFLEGSSGEGVFVWNVHRTGQKEREEMAQKAKMESVRKALAGLIQRMQGSKSLTQTR